MSNIIDYINYFRTLATEHQQIAHDPNSELPDYEQKKDCHFALFHSDEVVAGLRSSISDGVVLLLHPYYINGDENSSKTTFNSTQEAAFLLVKQCDHNNINELVSAMAETEAIVWDLVRRIYNDSKRGAKHCGLFHHIDLNSFKIEPVQNLFEERAGWYVKFSFMYKQTDFFNEDLTDNPNSPWNE